MISGAAVVRAFGDAPRMLALADARVDDANRSLYYLWATNQVSSNPNPNPNPKPLLPVGHGPGESSQEHTWP